MSQKGLANLLKAVVIGMALCMAAFYIYLLPEGAKIMFFEDTVYQPYYFHWLVMVWITAVPVYLAFICGWRVAAEIGRDNSFSDINARMLKNIAILAVIDSVYIFVASFVFFVQKMVEDSWMLMAVMIAFVGVMVTIVAAALSHLIYKAAQMKEENDLTI